MKNSSHTPGAASVIVRVALGAISAFVLLGIPENMSSWDVPNASTVPSERVMPAWGNYLVAVAYALAIVMLALGWALRRRTAQRRGWAVWLDGVTIALLTAWAGVLVASIWISTRPEPEEAVIGTALPDFGIDAALAVMAAATAIVLVRDLLAFRRSAAPTSPAAAPPQE